MTVCRACSCVPSTGVRSHVEHAGFLAAVGEITYHFAFQTAGIHQNRAGFDAGKRLLDERNGDALVQADDDHIISAVLHGAGAVNTAVLQCLFQNVLPDIAAVYGMLRDGFDGFADGTADESHADYKNLHNVSSLL